MYNENKNQSIEEASAILAGSVSNQTKEEKKKIINDTEKEFLESLEIKFTRKSFIGTQRADMFTTTSVAQMIADDMGRKLSDFVGCIILPDKYGNPNLACYFTDMSELPDINGKYKAICNSRTFVKSKFEGANILTQQLVNSIYAVSNGATNKQGSYTNNYNFTKEGKSLLGKIMYGYPNNINWKQRMSERSETGIPGSRLLLEVTGFNLPLIISKIYGHTGKVQMDGEETEEHHFEYNAQIKMPVGGCVYNGTPAPTNYMMMVSRYDIEKMNEIMSKCGAPTVVGNIPMVRPAGI